MLSGGRTSALSSRKPGKRKKILTIPSLKLIIRQCADVESVPFMCSKDGNGPLAMKRDATSIRVECDRMRVSRLGSAGAMKPGNSRGGQL